MKINPQIPKEMYDLKASIKANEKRIKEYKKSMSELEGSIFQHNIDMIGTNHDSKYCPTCKLFIKKLDE